jgi:hypothetical protein
MVWRVTTYGSWIVIDDHFFFYSLFSLSNQVKCMIVLFFLSISVLILLVYYFVLIPFIEVFSFFNLVLQLQFLVCFVFHFGPYSFDFWFLIFFLCSFVKVYFAFNFIFQSKFLLFFFQFDPHFFDWFFL